MDFKLPTLVQKRTFIQEVKDIPVFKLDELTDLKFIGSGSFGAVFTAERKTNNDNCETVVVKKMTDEGSEKENIKEARMLHRLHHPNVVSFLGLCFRPSAIMLEYVYFDFSPFNSDMKVNSLSEFLLYVNAHDEFQTFNTCGLIVKIGQDVISGLSYLHSKDIVHRDLKCDNVLVSNQHYCHLTKKEISDSFQANPIVCKVADFGESRSKHSNISRS